MEWRRIRNRRVRELSDLRLPPTGYLSYRQHVWRTRRETLLPAIVFSPKRCSKNYSLGARRADVLIRRDGRSRLVAPFREFVAKERQAIRTRGTGSSITTSFPK